MILTAPGFGNFSDIRFCHDMIIRTVLEKHKYNIRFKTVFFKPQVDFIIPRYRHLSGKKFITNRFLNF